MANENKIAFWFEAFNSARPVTLAEFEQEHHLSHITNWCPSFDITLAFLCFRSSITKEYRNGYHIKTMTEKVLDQNFADQRRLYWVNRINMTLGSTMTVEEFVNRYNLDGSEWYLALDVSLERQLECDLNKVCGV